AERSSTLTMRRVSLTRFLKGIAERRDNYVLLHLAKYRQLRKGRAGRLPTAIVYAYFDNKPLLWKLIRRGLNVDEADESGTTLLMTAASLGDTRSIERLLDLRR